MRISYCHIFLFTLQTHLTEYLVCSFHEVPFLFLLLDVCGKQYYIRNHSGSAINGFFVCLKWDFGKILFIKMDPCYHKLP